MSTKAMSSAEFIATRHLVGLTVDQLGEQLNISERTIRNWQSGKYFIGDSAAEAVRDLRSEHDTELEKLLEDAVGGDSIVLPRGTETYPAGWYVALASRILDRDPGLVVEWEDSRSNDA